jgi:hypothetical protein
MEGVETSEGDAEVSPVEVDQTILYADRSSLGGQLLIRSLLRGKTKQK